MRELGIAVAWARQRITHERLLFELRALQVPFNELLPAARGAAAAAGPAAKAAGAAGAAAGAGASAAPRAGVLRLRLSGVVGEEQVAVRLPRRKGLAPATVGIDEVVLCACACHGQQGSQGSQDGWWSMHVRGTFYQDFVDKGSGAGVGAGGFAVEAAACGRAANCSSSRGGGGCEVGGGGGGWVRFDYCFHRGQHVRDALLHLLRMAHVLRLLCRLEGLALGAHSLPVASSSHPLAPVQGHPQERQQQEGEQAGLRPAKRPRMDGAAGAGAAAGASGGEEGTQVNGNGGAHHLAVPNGLSFIPDGGPAGAGAAACNGVSPSSGNGASGAAAPGLVWHWPGSGTVLLVGCSSTAVVLECGQPLPAPPSAAGGAALDSGGRRGAAAADGSNGTGPEQQDRGRRRLRLMISWSPPEEASGVPDTAAASAAAAVTAGSAPEAACVLLRLRCRVRGGAPGLGASLQVFGEMAGLGEEGLMLDALAICGWPYACLGAALERRALQQAGIRPREVSLHGRGSSPYLARLLIGPPAGAATAAQQAGGGTAAAAGAAALQAVDLSFAKEGLVRLVLAAPAMLPTPKGDKGKQQQQAPQQQALTELLPRLTAAAPDLTGAIVPDARGPGGGVWVRASKLARLLPQVILLLQQEKEGQGAGG